MDATAHARVRTSIDEARRQLGPPSAPPSAPSVLGRVIEEVAEGTREHPGLWLGGAVLVGFALARLVVPPPSRVRRIEVAARTGNGSLVDSAWRAGISWARPQLAEYGKRKLAEFLQNTGTPAQDAGAVSRTGMPPQDSAA
jgi:hypothetical protein